MECPFCLKANDCSLNEGLCWCFEETIPHGLLVHIPAEKVGVACVCKACILKYHQNNDEFIRLLSNH